MTKKGRLIAIILASTIAINGLMAATILPAVNGLASKYQPADSESTKKKTSKEEEKQPPIPAEAALDKLIALTPTPENWVQQGENGTIPLGTILDAQCGPGTIAPVVSRSRSYATSTSQGDTGASVQIVAYSAGLGAKAVEEIKSRVTACKTTRMSAEDLGYATQSFTFDDEGGEGADGRTLVARVGDIVAFIALRGVDLDIANKWGNDWYSQWAGVLTTDICAEQTSTIEDVKRSPISGEYSQGWLHRENVELDAARKDAADIAGRVLVRTKNEKAIAAGEPSIDVIPEKALDGAALNSLPNVPAEVSFTLSTKPADPVAPTFPEAPITASTAVSRVSDPIGPGCGWAFTGQSAPEFEDKEAEKAAQKARIAAAGELIKARSAWWVARYDYAVAYAKYMKEVDAWNAWVAEGSKAIATAWWAYHDSQMVKFTDAKMKYVEELAKWESQCSSVTVISNEPSTTPTPTPTSDICATKPTAPVTPDAPPMPRP